LAELLEVLGHASELAANEPEGVARFDPLVHQAALTDLVKPGGVGADRGAVGRELEATTFVQATFVQLTTLAPTARILPQGSATFPECCGTGGAIGDSTRVSRSCRQTNLLEHRRAPLI